MVCHPCKVAGYFDCADSGIHAASSFALVVSDPWGLLSDNMPVAEAAIRHSAIDGTRHMSPIRDVKAWSTRRWLSEIDANVAHFHNWWPDRLGNSRWRRCLEIMGQEHLDRALVSGPVVLVTVHYGDLRLLLYALRSTKLTAAFMARQNSTNRCPVRRWIDNLADAANEMSDIPSVFETNEIGKAHDYLAGGKRILGIAVDGSLRRAISVRDGGSQISLAPGALTMAQLTSAHVIPCIISRVGGFRYAINYSPPVAADLLVDSRGHEAAMNYVWYELRSVIWNRIEQSLPTLIARFRHDVEHVVALDDVRA